MVSVGDALVPISKNFCLKDAVPGGRGEELLAHRM